MKFFTAFLATETNTFAAAPTGWGCFREYGIFRGDASTRDPQGFGLYPLTLRRWLAEQGHELVESTTAFAMPLGRTVREVYEGLRDEILADLQAAHAAGPLDGVILVLHGAMVADGYDDCEGDLIERARAIVGPTVPIGVELDLHCHYTALMQRSADVIVAYKEYPHTDALPRLREVLDIVLKAAQGLVKPSTAVFDCKMVGLWHTTREPMAGFVRRMQAVEQQAGVLSVSLGHGFPWADVAEGGAKLWVTTDNDAALAAALAEQLGREFWALREQTRTPNLSIGDALTQALAVQGGPVVLADVAEGGAKLWVTTDNDAALAAALAEQLGREFWALREQTRTPNLSIGDALTQALAVQGGPVVLADVADNAGGGAMSDSTFILRELLAQGIADVAIGGFWDLGAVQICSDAGVGARVELRLGGKGGPASGAPLDLSATVMAVVEDFYQPGLNGSSDGGDRMALGRSVWVRLADGIDIALISKRSQVLDPQLFTGLGIELARKRLIVVKSAQHFHARFAPLAKAVFYVSTPGTVNTDFASLPYRVRSLDYWPRVADPHWLAPAAQPPGRLYEIDGLRLHLHLSGPVPTDPRQPTIVIESGAGTVSPVYARLQRTLARKYPVCSYDRPGLGWSQPDAQPLDAERNARRLHALLDAAGVRGPLLFIGHSLGGLLMRVYTGLYPEQVAGLMMLDASHPDQFALYDEAPTEQMAAERAKRVKLRAGGPPPPEFAMIDAVCADMPEVAEQVKSTFTPEAVDAMLYEVQGLRQVGSQAAAAPDLGERPLVVLWAPKPPAPTGIEGLDAVYQRWPGYQQAHAELSTRGRVRELAGSEHMSIAVLPPFVAQVAEEVDALMAQIAAAPGRRREP
ncbi:alpha/beta fold hydrolase [Roseateles cavernae]|uniref:alpha/beta fold hydrolase n=1 Tax=Roseateles cavernae TaxID=3153578 RepID=UPI0032E39D64